MNKDNSREELRNMNALAFSARYREKRNKICYLLILIAVVLLAAFSTHAIAGVLSYYGDHGSALAACKSKAEGFIPHKYFGVSIKSCVHQHYYERGYAGYDFCVIYNIADSGEDHIVQCIGSDENLIFKYPIPYKRTDITKYYESLETARIAAEQEYEAVTGRYLPFTAGITIDEDAYLYGWSGYFFHLQTEPPSYVKYSCDNLEAWHDHLSWCEQHFYIVPFDGCQENQRLDTTGLCVPENPILKNAGNSCKKKELFKGNPINISIGNKYQRETDYRAGSRFPLTVSRSYNSVTKSWRLFSGIREISASSSVDVIRTDGKALTFIIDNGVWVSDLDIVGMLTAAEDGQGNITGWTYKTENDQTETYDAQGRVLSVTERSGLSHTYSYQTDSITVTHTSGDALVYHLDSEGRVSGFTNPDNKNYQYSYDAEGRLASITFPDATPTDTTDNPKRTYHYENTDFPHALTGITDENGNRYATWSYDSEGRAISSEHSGGVDKTTLTYNADGTTTVTNPLGKQTTYHFTTIHGVRKVTQVEGHPTASCEGANKSYSYDANGNVSSKTDWNGVITNYTYDMDRNLELTRTEAAGTPQERTISTEWHSQFRLPSKITEPSRITEYSYDAQGSRLSSSVKNIQ